MYIVEFLGTMFLMFIILVTVDYLAIRYSEMIRQNYS